MKQVTEELRYDGATLEQVHEMLADPTFRAPPDFSAQRLILWRSEALG